MKKQAGFSLVEVAVAIGLAAFALVAVLGLLPIGLSAQQNALEETKALHMATAIVADLRLASANPDPSRSSRFAVPLPREGQPTGETELFLTENGSTTTAQQARYRFIIKITPPPGQQHRPSVVNIRASWPAPAAPAAAAGRTELVTTLIDLPR